MMATSRPALRAASRTMVARSMWSCAVPWLKFSRTTLTLARIICSSNSGVLEAGPRVATILVAWRGMRSELMKGVSVLYSLLYTLCVSNGSQSPRGISLPWPDRRRNQPAARLARISKAGRVLPSSTSRKAPPPVEM
ncbi:hypothetical protein D3C86_759270 [compost metagenome]